MRILQQPARTCTEIDVKLKTMEWTMWTMISTQAENESTHRANQENLIEEKEAKR